MRHNMHKLAIRRTTQAESREPSRRQTTSDKPVIHSTVEAAAAAGDAGAAYERQPNDQRGRMVCRVAFAPETVAALQTNVESFEASLKAIIEGGEASFWGPAGAPER